MCIFHLQIRLFNYLIYALQFWKYEWNIYDTEKLNFPSN